MRGAIYAATREKGLSCLKSVIIIKSHCNIKCTRKVITKYDAFAEFEDGSIWRVVTCEASRRGYKWHECYIDRDLDPEIIADIKYRAAPYNPFSSLSAPEIPLEERMHYF